MKMKAMSPGQLAQFRKIAKDHTSTLLEGRYTLLEVKRNGTPVWTYNLTEKEKKKQEDFLNFTVKTAEMCGMIPNYVAVYLISKDGSIEPMYEYGGR